MVRVALNRTARCQPEMADSRDTPEREEDSPELGEGSAGGGRDGGSEEEVYTLLFREVDSGDSGLVAVDNLVDYLRSMQLGTSQNLRRSREEVYDSQEDVSQCAPGSVCVPGSVCAPGSVCPTGSVCAPGSVWDVTCGVSAGAADSVQPTAAESHAGGKWPLPHSATAAQRLPPLGSGPAGERSGG